MVATSAIEDEAHDLVQNKCPLRLEILLIEDDADIAETLEDLLEIDGHDVTRVADGEMAMERVRTRTFDLVISDVRLPKLDGMTIFRWLRQHAPETQVILMSAYGTISEAVASVRNHAAHYLAKPFEAEDLLEAVREVALNLRANASSDSGFQSASLARLVGDSVPMAELRRRIQAVADSSAAVLIVGESGTGKELVARAIHEGSTHAHGPFVAVNCAALPDTLLEAELFGHEKGAFTGAHRHREGRFVAARNGTLFLDEVADLPPNAQAKLLRVLQEGQFQPVGANTDQSSNARIISASNADLRQRVAEGRFREDLYYRLRVVEIQTPPLRERREDLAALVGYFLARSSPTRRPTLSPQAWAALYHHPFPGNVRELEHAIEHALLLSDRDTLDVHHLPDEFHAGVDLPEASESGIRPLNEALSAFERDYLRRALHETGGRKARTARLLKISRKTLWKKLRRYDPETFHEEDE